MALNARQMACYVHRAHVYRTLVPVVAGVPQAATFTKVYSAIPCHYVFTGNVDDPTGVGRVKRPTEFTRDHVSTDQAYDIRNGDMIVNVTSGSRAANPLYGQVHRLEGIPKVVSGGGRRLVNKQSFEIFVEPHPPTGVVV